MTPKNKGILITLFSGVIFGLYPPFSKACYLDGANPSCVILVSSLFRAIAFVIDCLVKKLELKTKNNETRSFLFAGFFQAVSIFAILSSFSFIPTSVAMTIMFTHTMMQYAYLCFKKEKKFTKVAFFSTASALIGVSFVVGLWTTNIKINMIGIILSIIAAIVTATRLYLFQKELENSHPSQVGARIFIIVCICCLVFNLFYPLELPKSSIGYLYLLLASLSLVIGTFGMFHGIKLLGSFEFSLLIKIEPIFTSIFSAIILGEILLPNQYFGMMLVLSSIIFYQYYESKNKLI